jgi:DnaK suppressor protein
MAKAQKAPEKSSKSTKVPVKEPPKKAAKELPAPAAKNAKTTSPKTEPVKTPPKVEAPKAAAKPVAAAPVKAAPAKEAPKPASAAKEPEKKAAKATEVIQVRAHEDAKLTKAEMQGLYAMLIEEKTRVLQNFETHVGDALSDEDILADEMDIAQRSTDQASFFRMADKDRKLLIEIDVAIEKMKNGEYGLCEGTDEPIGFKRLEIRPWTRYSVAYKELLEREKAQQAR